MSMKLSPVGSRIKSSKGFKVKHVLHAFLLLVVSVWLLYQLKHSYNKKAAAAVLKEAGHGGLPTEETEAAEQGILFRLGRKDLIRPIVSISSNEVSMNGVVKGELDEESDEVKGDEIDDDEGGRRLDGRDQERTEEEEPEEVEDLIDVDDRERDDQRNEDGKADGEEDHSSISLLDDDDDDDDEVKEMGRSRV